MFTVVCTPLLFRLTSVSNLVLCFWYSCVILVEENEMSDVEVREASHQVLVLCVLDKGQFWGGLATPACRCFTQEDGTVTVMSFSSTPWVEVAERLLWSVLHHFQIIQNNLDYNQQLNLWNHVYFTPVSSAHWIAFTKLVFGGLEVKPSPFTRGSRNYSPPSTVAMTILPRSSWGHGPGAHFVKVWG